MLFEQAAVPSSSVADARRALRDLDGALWLDPRLRELVEARTAELNGCPERLARHVREAIELGEAPQRLAQLAEWRLSERFDERERAALVLAEALALPDPGAVAAACAAASRHLEETELEQVVVACVAESAWDRLELGLGG